MQIAVCRHKHSPAHKTALLSASKVSVGKRMESTEPNPAMIKNEITLAPQGDGTFRVNFVQVGGCLFFTNRVVSLYYAQMRRSK
jgi:hypothetical protein